ncbi:MAG TPA: hypothetical protein PLI98_16980 [Candidatus Hydrogenedentes bacterium]|nr:hypothetical protein [Candidatus Hydrogenedentota bacterium]
MLYFRTSQFVPGKGDAWTYYECDDSQKVLRQLTHIPETGETTRVPDPIVTRLYRPELLVPASGEEFISLWQEQKP